MADEHDSKKNQPSLPPNYVSILHLQEQWLHKKQKQKEEEEAAKRKQIEIETEQKKQELAAEKQIRHAQKHQRQGNYVKASEKVDKSNLGRFQGSDRPGYSQRRGIDRSYQKGVYKDREKGKIGEVGEKGVDSGLCRIEERGDFERCDGKVRPNGGGGGGGFGVVMSLHVVAVEEGEIVGVMKRDDGFRGGLMSNMGDLGVNNDVSENLGEGETMVETKEGSERGKKVDDGAMRVGHKKNGLFRPSRGNKGDPPVNFGDSDNVGRREGVEETEDDLEGKDDARISDLGVAVEVGNVKKRSRWGSKKNRNKKGLSMGEFGRGTGQGQGSRRDVREENGIQLDLKKDNVGENGEGNGDSIEDVEDVADMRVAIEVKSVEQKGRGGYKKNRNKKGLSRCEFGRGTEQGQGNGRDVGEEGIMLHLRKGNGGKNGEEGTGDDIGDGEGVVDMGVASEVMNVEQRSSGGYKKNRNKKGLSRSEFGRGTGQGQENGRGMGEENVIQLDMKKENGGKNGEERSGDNMGDGKDVADMGVAIEVVMNVEQRSRGGYKKNWNMKDLFRCEFGRGTEQGQENGSGMGEDVIQLDLEKDGVQIGDGRSGDNMRDGKGEAEKEARWKEWKHKRVSVGRRNGNARMMDNTTWGYEKWVVKGDRAGAKIIQNTVEENSKIDELVEEIPVIVSEINENTDLCSDGSQRNDCDNTVNFGLQSNRMEKNENQKQELVGNHEDSGLLMTNEAYGERARFRDKTRGNRYEGFSREKTRRDFKELSLNSQRVGNGRKQFQIHGHKWRFQKDPQFGENHRNTGLVWVKKGDIADISET